MVCVGCLTIHLSIRHRYRAVHREVMFRNRGNSRTVVSGARFVQYWRTQDRSHSHHGESQNRLPRQLAD